MKAAALPAVVAALGLLTACTKGSFEGKLVNGLTGEPIPEMRVLLKGETTDFTCQVFEATTDASGSFKVEGTCADISYALEPGDEAYFLDKSTGAVTGGEPSTGAVEVKAWQAPKGAGVYTLKDGELKSLRTFADVKAATILDTEQKVRYPETQPKDDKSWPPVPEGGYLVLVGKTTIDRLQLLPAIQSPEIKFAPDREGITHWSLGGPWYYIGIEMTSETEFAEKTVQIDAAKVVNADGADESRVAQYIQADAVPDGKYALVGPEDRRTYLIRFGDAAAAPAEGAEAGEGEGG
ncbi:MAG: hypothetical protein H6739_22815 [Alphaproteobacteria bacterium]|nr:hypothetical protein [Alphaproteobacteria bacterium]